MDAGDDRSCRGCIVMGNKPAEVLVEHRAIEPREVFFRRQRANPTCSSTRVTLIAPIVQVVT